MKTNFKFPTLAAPLLVSLTIFSATQAQASGDAPLNSGVLKSASILMKCIRRGMEGHKGGAQGLTQYLQLLESTARISNPTVDQLDKQSNLCQDLTLKLSDSRERISSRQASAHFAQTVSRYSHATVMIAKDILTPTIRCKKGGVEAAVAIIVGLGVKGDVAYCSSSTGRRWAEIRVGGGMGPGFVGHATISGGRDERNENNHKAPFSSVNYRSDAGGLVLAFSVEGADDMLRGGPKSPEYNRSFGLGLGVGVDFMGGVQGVLKAIPLGVDDSVLAKKLLVGFQK